MSTISNYESTVSRLSNSQPHWKKINKEQRVMRCLRSSVLIISDFSSKKNCVVIALNVLCCKDSFTDRWQNYWKRLLLWGGQTSVGRLQGFLMQRAGCNPKKILLIPISLVLSMLFRMHLHSAVGTREPEPRSLLSENSGKSEQYGPGFKDTGNPVSPTILIW